MKTDELLYLLNDEQRSAVLDTEHNLLILACAGSGKTRTITAKIAYYIASSILAPREILAVTFTNKAAYEMRERVKALLPDYDLAGLEMRTFHSFGAFLLRMHAKEAGLESNFSIYDDQDSLQLLSSVCPGLEKKELREIYKSISKAKDMGIDASSNIFTTIDDSSFVQEAYEKYEDALRKTGNVDFSDLILLSYKLLENNARLRERYQNRFRLVLVDEYQDSNRMQFRLLRLLCSDKSTQVCVVGDDDQSIYSFRGAEIENILTFSSSFSNVRQIKLEKNYRSTTEILSAASALIKTNTMRHEKAIISANDEHGSIPVLYSFPDAKSEAESIADDIKKSGRFENTAILYRTNAQSSLFERAFMDKKIPYTVIGALRFYEREEIKDALAILFLLANRRDYINFKRIINKPKRGIGEKKIEEIAELSSDLIDAVGLYKEKTSAAASKGLENFLSSYNDASEEIRAGEMLSSVLERALYRFGLISYYESEADESVYKARMENITALLSSLKDEGSGIEALYSYLEKITLDRTTRNGDGKEEKSGVVLITMHNTKGLEYDNVYVTGLEEELIPGRNGDNKRLYEEEKRILYVALTRARKKLTLSYARSRALYGSYSQARHESSFLSLIPSSLYRKEIIKSYNISDYSGYRIRPSFGSQKGAPSWAKSIRMEDIASARFDSEKGSGEHLYEGDRVISPSYGTGLVLSVEENGASRMLLVRFPDGDMRLNEKYSKLKKVEEKSTLSISFSSGDRVRSLSYGEGCVDETLINASGDKILSVIFDSGKKIKILESKAKLEKI